MKTLIYTLLLLVTVVSCAYDLNAVLFVMMNFKTAIIQPITIRNRVSRGRTARYHLSSWVLRLKKNLKSLQP